MLNNINNLQAIINNAQHTAQQLIRLLKKEHKILITGENSALEDVAAKKIEQLLILESYQSELSPHFAKSNQTQLPIKSQQSQPIQNKWQEFLGLLNECRRLNNRNGYIINTSLHNSQTSLAILRGQDHDDIHTYTYDGHRQRQSSPRTIAKI